MSEEKEEHEPGCPAIADDESDYEYLYDAGICVCKLSEKEITHEKKDNE